MMGCQIVGAIPSFAAGGTLTLEAEDESSESPAITRLELWRAESEGRPRPPRGATATRRLIAPRRTAPAGVGVVLDRSVDLSLRDGHYAFRAIRGPEYRIVSGSFTLERDSLDQHTVRLPRMVDMLRRGWTSGDCLVPLSPGHLPLRMAAEDLHLATTLGPLEPSPIPGRKPNDPVDHEPSWIVEQADHDGGLVVYGAPSTGAAAANSGSETRLPVERLAAIDPGTSETPVAIENPFAWPLPVWLASGRIDGVFVLGDWLRLDRKVLRVDDGRQPDRAGSGDARTVGYLAEEIYWNLLEAGFQLPPLAGSGSDGAGIPVGYNRLYVGMPLEGDADEEREAEPVTSPEQWWDAAWKGHSVATNGPLLRPRLQGRLPGHHFHGREGEKLELSVELALTVRDPVQYLEVMHNGRVHYSARLDEFAAAGGEIPAILAEESGWVLVRIVTEFPDHFRAAISAPWYIEFEGRPRISRSAVDFFRSWLTDYEDRLKQLPPNELTRHVPYVRAARAFWAQRASETTAP